MTIFNYNTNSCLGVFLSRQGVRTPIPYLSAKSSVTDYGDGFLPGTYEEPPILEREDKKDKDDTNPIDAIEDSGTPKNTSKILKTLARIIFPIWMNKIYRMGKMILVTHKKTRTAESVDT